MMDIATSKVAFALGCTSVDFCLENEERAIAILPIPGKRGVPVSVVEQAGQPHFRAHLPFVIMGRAAWEAYRFFCLDDAAFGLGIDYSDGETTYVEALGASTVDELDKSMHNTQEFLRDAWVDLERFAVLSSNQSEEEANAFDISELIDEAFAASLGHLGD